MSNLRVGFLARGTIRFEKIHVESVRTGRDHLHSGAGHCHRGELDVLQIQVRREKPPCACVGESYRLDLFNWLFGSNQVSIGPSRSEGVAAAAMERDE